MKGIEIQLYTINQEKRELLEVSQKGNDIYLFIDNAVTIGSQACVCLDSKVARTLANHLLTLANKAEHGE